MAQYEEIKMQWTSWHHRLHKKLVKQPNLLPHGDCLLISVSGGQDSMGLLKLLIDLQRIHNWELYVWHGDHGWHEKSSEIAKELKLWCEKSNLNFFCDQTNIEETKTEKDAREWRYQKLFKLACLISSSSKDQKNIRVLTAHTGNDRAETLIMNLSRGSDLIGLSNLREERILDGNIKLIRPLLEFSRDETEKICRKMNLPIWIDPSNKNLNFTRNKIRHEVLPLLESLHIGCTSRISSLAERLSWYQEDQAELVLLALQTIKTNQGLTRKKIINLPLSTRRIILAKWLEINQIPGINSKILEEISYKISQEEITGSINLKDGWIIKLTKESIEMFNVKN
tara:strand:- start:6461 stop:7480 length:1020 start_codon:yes stop_codon:yes gene_type:complete